MRLLLDANLSPRIASALQASGHETLHVGDVDMLTANLPALETALAAGAIVSHSPTGIRVRDLPIV